jgi:multiple sugar transport system permease protein
MSSRSLNSGSSWSLFSVLLIGWILLCAFVMMVPFFWMISTSLRQPSESYALPPSLFPTKFHYENYVTLFRSSVPILLLFVNSAKITIIVVFVQVVTCSMAGYAFARLRFPGRDLLFGLLMLSLMIPIQVTIIPLYVAFSKVGLADNHGAVILLSLVNAFGVFLLRQFFLTLPKELEDAGKIDGAGSWKVFFRIALPQAGPSLSALVILSFNTTWNNYFIPLVFLSSWEKMTLPLGVAALRGFMGSGNLAVQMAAVTVAIVPVLLVFLFAQRYIVEGLTTTGIKG